STPNSIRVQQGALKEIRKLSIDGNPEHKKTATEGRTEGKYSNSAWALAKNLDTFMAGKDAENTHSDAYKYFTTVHHQYGQCPVLAEGKQPPERQLVLTSDFLAAIQRS